MSQDPIVLFLSFTLLVGGLVFVHELGHFLVAKAFGVHVVRFSLGFGPRLAGVRLFGTEYVLSLLPIGGYVQLLGETDLSKSDRDRFFHRTFDGQTVIARMLIVLAGPLMSLAFPFALFFFVFLADTNLHPPLIGEVTPGMPADGFLMPGDRVLEINGRRVRSYDDIKRIVEESADEILDFRIERRGEEAVISIVASAVPPEVDHMVVKETIGRIGILPVAPLPVIGVSSEQSPAYAAGLRTFDTIVSIGGAPITRADEIDRALLGRGLHAVVYLRPEPVSEILGGFAEIELFSPRVATLRPGQVVTGQLGAGIDSGDAFIRTVVLESPEYRAGIRPGDRLVAVDGEPVRLFRETMAKIERSDAETHHYVVRRGGELLGFDVRFPRGDRTIGIHNFKPYRAFEPVPNESRVSYALRESARRTAFLIGITWESLKKLFQGELNREEIGGPLFVFFAAGDAASEGAEQFLSLMAIISVNLGILNFLPIPLLDGGQFVFLCIESILRRPLPSRVRDVAVALGWLGLLALTIFALFNDIQRFFFG